MQTLHDVIDDTRLAVWQQQPADFFRQAIVDMDGFSCFARAAPATTT